MRLSSGDAGDLDCGILGRSGDHWRGDFPTGILLLPCRHVPMGGQLDADWEVILQGLYYLLVLTAFESLFSRIKEALVQGSASCRPQAHSGLHLFL